MIRPRAFGFAALLLAACSSKDPGPAVEQPLPGPPEWNKAVTPPADAAAKQARASCSYKKDALPAETQGASYPMGAQIPIDHIFVLMQENRSFDHYFQKLPDYGQKDAEVAPAGYSNPDKDGKPVAMFHSTDYCFVDTNHEWVATHDQLDGGKMDGFFKTNDGDGSVPKGGTAALLSGKRALGYYDQSDIPFYYWLANEFAIADRYFSALPGPTFPNRSYMYAATSFGVIGGGLPPVSATLLTDYLSERQLDWKIYRDGTAGMTTFVSKYSIYNGDGRFHTIAEFKADAAAGTLPAFAFIDPHLGLASGNYDNDDEHPAALAQTGQKFVAEIIDALAKSPNWPRSVLFLTYDEHGGLFDHVVPPKACPPDDIPPNPMENPIGAKFDQYGVRVPMIAISPYAKKHYVSHEVYDHTSLLRFIEARFVVPALTARDANALAPWDMFDFKTPPHLDPPKITIPTVPADKLAACKAIFAP